MALSIDIVSDVVCPWCFVGKRHLEAAILLYRARNPEAPEPTITFHPFELNPDMPPEGIPREDYVAGKFGAHARSAHERLVAIGARVGIAFAFDRIARQPNTLAAHAMIEWARRRGVQAAVKEALMEAFFVGGRDLTDPAALVEVAVAAGLDRGEAEACLSDEELRRTVATEEDRTRLMGIRGVPFFIFNGRLAVEGAHPPEVLLEAMLEAEKGSATG